MPAANVIHRQRPEPHHVDWLPALSAGRFPMGACPPLCIHVVTSTRQLRNGDARSIEEHESDVEAPVGIDCPSVARHQGQFVLDSRGADESVVHRSAGDAECAEPGQQLGGRVIAEETRRGKVVRDETGDRPRTPSRRRWQPSEDRECLERRMAGKAKCPVANRIDNSVMVLVISHYERNSDAGINQSGGFESRPTSVGQRHEALAPARRRW